MQSDWEHRSCRHRLGRQSQGRSGSQAWSCAHCALCWWWRGPHAGRLPEKTKINIIIKHLSTHISIFSSAMALENVQNRFFGLKTVKVVLKQVFQWEKGQIANCPQEPTLVVPDRSLSRFWQKECLCLCSYLAVKETKYLRSGGKPGQNTTLKTQLGFRWDQFENYPFYLDINKCWSRRKPNWVLVCPYFHTVFCFLSCLQP